ncbi:hypothetical protein SKAU_G00391590 [Synaphobranchus kaupii]|uniref:Uncharacterized protein n=1 Tax=Synaphobranchus kaupii TaxID=118154 RepID=A0A9Q1EBP4_SYNKA|nr:hypothetical protein SKAU_G00391590 [Synaphobranchus kaupii]
MAVADWKTECVAFTDGGVRRRRARCWRSALAAGKGTEASPAIAGGNGGRTPRPPAPCVLCGRCGLGRLAQVQVSGRGETPQALRGGKACCRRGAQAPGNSLIPADALKAKALKGGGASRLRGAARCLNAGTFRGQMLLEKWMRRTSKVLVFPGGST